LCAAKINGEAERLKQFFKRYLHEDLIEILKAAVEPYF